MPEKCLSIIICISTVLIKFRGYIIIYVYVFIARDAKEIHDKGYYLILDGNANYGLHIFHPNTDTKTCLLKTLHLPKSNEKYSTQRSNRDNYKQTLMCKQLPIN